MNEVGTKRHLDVVTALCTNRYFLKELPRGGKYNAVGDGSGGYGITAVPNLQHLGFQTSVCGRYTADDESARTYLLAEGAHWRMHKADGRGAVNAVLGQDSAPTVLRVVRPNYSWDPTKEEGAYLSASPAAAFVLGGSLGREYTEFVIATAAATGKPVFWNASGTADLQLAGIGEVFLQVSYAEFSNGQGPPPKTLAASLLASTGATSCVVSDSVRGSYGVLRGSPVMHAPAIRLPAEFVRRALGAGDAHHAGFVAGFLNTPEASRLERALHLGRLLAAYHVTAAPPGGWYHLGLFEKRFYRPDLAPIRAAA